MESVDAQIMKLSEFKRHLEENPGHHLKFVLPDEDEIPAHAHITEVGRVEKTFVDCGGTTRKASCCCLQTWVADDTEHRLHPEKLAQIIERAAIIFERHDLPVEIEYEDCCSFSQYPVSRVTVSNGILQFHLISKHTDCLAKDVCLSRESSDGGRSCC